MFFGLLIGVLLAINDLFVQGILKNISLGVIKYSWILIAALIYAIQPWIFLKGLSITSMTILNLTWDLISDILITIMGFFYFKESITGLKSLGILFSLVAITLFSIDETTVGPK